MFVFYFFSSLKSFRSQKFSLSLKSPEKTLPLTMIRSTWFKLKHLYLTLHNFICIQVLTFNLVMDFLLDDIASFQGKWNFKGVLKERYTGTLGFCRGDEWIADFSSKNFNVYFHFFLFANAYYGFFFVFKFLSFLHSENKNFIFI